MPTIRGLLSDLNNTMNVAYPPLAALNAARKVMPNITMSGLLGGTVESAKKAYTAPIRAMRGEFDADSPQAYEEALNLAGMIGSSSLPRLTQPVQHGVTSMFIGPKAKTWNAAKAAEAEKMLAEGADPKQVWSKTGTMRGVDGFLRQEIDDSGAMIYDEKPALMEAMVKAIKSGNDKRIAEAKNDFLSYERPYQRTYQDTGLGMRQDLDSIMGHKALDDAYMITPYTRYKYDAANPKIGEASYSPANNQITLSPQMPEEAKSSILHELQHAIQEREGWARGGSPDTSSGVGITKDDTLDFARKAYEDSHQSSGDPLLDELFSGAKKWEELTPREQLGWIDQGRMYAYSRLAGEAEARLTQTRMNMTPEQRLATYPYDQLDVPLNQLIVRGLLK